ncbi:MAG: hypothetical protein V3S26_02195, partial [Acidimicrobiia bacterium]
SRDVKALNGAQRVMAIPSPFFIESTGPYLPIGQHPVERQSLRSHSSDDVTHRWMVLTAARHFGILPV